MMRLPPTEPSAAHGLPSASKAMMGAIELRGRLPGPTALASGNVSPADASKLSECQTVLVQNADGGVSLPGRIVTLSSVAGLIGNRGQVNYSAAKAGIIGATKALALELAKRDITVNCVAPGLIETDMTGEVPLADALKLIPARRVGKPEEVAALVSFLLSADAAYITRQVISVNGGLA